MAKIRRAVEITEQIFAATLNYLQVGMTEKEATAFMHAQVAQAGVGFAWSKGSNPAVNSGPHGVVGHAGPTDIRIQPGHLLHFDFGVRFEEYCSDIQRMVYILRCGETNASAEVRRGFETVRAAVAACRAAVVRAPGARPPCPLQSTAPRWSPPSGPKRVGASAVPCVKAPHLQANQR